MSVFNYSPIFAIGLLLTGLCSADDLAYERAPIHYSKTRAETPLTKIRDRIANGEDLLSGRSDQDILVKLLGLLDIPLESQLLVFSKTSQQSILVSANRPRAIYFSDNAYVGWVQKGEIEVITFDPNLGMVFHILSIANGEENETIKFVRRTSCLSCHGSKATENWPGLTIRSVYASRSGEPNLRAGTIRTDHASPLHERWGGWYVTGNAGDQTHRGNSIGIYDSNPAKATFQAMVSKPIESLAGLFPTEPYPGGPYSDIVALMVLEHQLTVHNALVQGHLSVRLDSSEENILNQADKITAALLLKSEYPLKNGIKGSDKFQTVFAKQKRSKLKEFNLKTRLFNYRCSYLIHSEAFNHLPEPLQKQVFSNLRNIMTKERSEYSYLEKQEKQHIHLILTKAFDQY